jgi:Tol biopolymer transport system component/serine/threonine protein kinase
MKPPRAPGASENPSADSDPTGATRPTRGAAVLLTPGEVLAHRFRVLARLGHGGMGEVYEAFDLELREHVALKVIRPALAIDPRAMERFRREIQLARKVTHPNVCRIFDLEHHRDARREIAFLTMELLRGETLAERLEAGGRMPLAEARPLIAQMAEGLAAAHRAGIVHRDFKPANVILVPETGGARAAITDFGVACLSGEAALSEEGRPVLEGTLGYLAPELTEGREATPASDVYSLGVVIHQMATGVPPHSSRTLFGKKRRRPISPRVLIPTLDPEWETLILRCLEPDPAHRFANAAEFVQALKEPGRLPARRPTVARRFIWVSGLAAAILLLSAAVLWRQRPKAPPPPEAVTPVQVTTSASLDVFPEFSPDGLQIAYASDRDGSFRIYVKALAAAGTERTLVGEGDNFQPAWSPDGRWIAFHRKRAGVWLVPAAGGPARPLTDFGSHPAWAPDGSKLVFQSEPLLDLASNAFPAVPPSVLWTVSIDGHEAKPLTRAGEPTGGHGSPAWSPDGKRIVFSAADLRKAEIWSIGADGRDPVRLVKDQPYAFDPVYSPDGAKVYYCSWSGRLTYGIWSVALHAAGRPQGLPSEEANIGALRLRHTAVSGDGRRVAYSGQTLTSNLWSVDVAGSEAGGRPRPLTADTGKTSRPAFSPDGRKLAFDRGRPGNPTDLWVMDPSGGNALPVTTHRAEDHLASWFPDGRRLAFVSDRGGRAALWSVPLDGGAETALLELPQDFDWPRLSPDGKRVAFHSRAGGRAINTWVAALPGGKPRQLTFDAELMGFPAWSPDGGLLALEMKRGEHTHIAVVPSGGGTPVPLTSADGQSWPFSWSPDGDAIAFAGWRDGVWNVWTVSRSTRKQTRLTDHTRLSAYVRTPAFSPRGDRVVYEYAETTGNIWLVDLPQKRF